MSGPIAAPFWGLLGIEPTTDRVAIKKAYARRLKEIDPETDPAAFIELRQARDWAMAQEQALQASAAPPIETPLPPPAPPERPAIEPDPTPAAHAAPDGAALATLQAMVLAPASTATPIEIAERAELVLSDPSLANIDEAGRMEAIISDLIVRGTPRSDALLDAAIRHFRWDADRPDLERQAIVGWVAQRQADINFENALPNFSIVYAGLLRDLRRPDLPRRSRWTAWRFGTRAEYLLTLLNQRHPTILAGADRSKLDWWAARSAEQKAAALPVRWWRERWRRGVWARGLDQRVDPRLVYLWFLIIVMPYLFVWFLLRPRHGMTARVVGFGYLAALTLLISHGGAPRTATPASAPAPLAADVVEQPRYTDFATDVAPLIAGATSGTVATTTLAARNPALWRALQAQWQAAVAAGTPPADYRTQARTMLDAVLGAALKQGNDKLLTDYASADNSRLRWAQRGSPEECVDAITGSQPVTMLSDFADYHGRLVGRAILAGTPPPPGQATHHGKRSFAIPPTIFDDAQRRSRSPKAEFQKALLGKGEANARCNARIALVDAAIASNTPEGKAVLRDIFAPR